MSTPPTTAPTESSGSNASEQILAEISNLTLRTQPTKKERPFAEPDKMVTFIVGSMDKKNFVIHKEIACQSSIVFDKAFNGGNNEALTQTYELDDVDPEAFRYLSEWMYSGKLTLIDHSFDDIDYLSIKDRLQHFEICLPQSCALCTLWILADRLIIPKLQNTISPILVKLLKKGCVCQPELFNYVFDDNNTSKDSQLRRLIADVWAWKSSDYLSLKLLPRKMLFEVAYILAQDVPKRIRDRNCAKIGDYDYCVVDPEEDTEEAGS